MKKILLTGGSGFVGRNLQEYISEYCSGEYEVSAPSSKELNVLDEDSVRAYLESAHFDIVLHFAVYTDAVDKSKDGSKMLEYNLLSFMNFYNHRDLYGRMFYSGSGAEFDKRYDIVSAQEAWLEKPVKGEPEGDEGPEGTGNPEGRGGVQSVPTDPYGLMKYTIGQLINESSNIFNVRIFGLFGKYEYPGRFITEMCHRSIEGRPFEVRQNVYFDYLYIDDFCRMLMLLIGKENLKYHSYNVVSGRRTSLLEICDMVNSSAEKYDIPMQTITVEKDGLNKEYTASAGRFLEEFPDYEFISMPDSVERLYSVYLAEKE